MTGLIPRAAMVAACLFLLVSVRAHADLEVTDWTRSPAAGPSARSAPAIVYDSFRDRLVLFGGISAGIRMDDTWEWDGSAWTQVMTRGPRRVGVGLAYDSSRHRVVMFGGDPWSADTWEYDGTNWTPIPTAISPPAREDGVMTYDALRERTVLFGGVGCTGLCNDTWEWDGLNWTELHPTVSPSRRGFSAMTYDSVRQRAVLFGGHTDLRAPLNDTWEWDGGNWTQAQPVQTLIPRFGHVLAFDTLRGVTVMFGGTDGRSEYTYETWEWDGVDWTQPLTTNHPTARTYSGGAFYEGVQPGLVIFGGYDGRDQVADTWIYAIVPG
jgi:hypothetical protein